MKQRGITPASLMACLLAMLAMGMLIQYSDITIGVSFASEHALALPAIWVLVPLLALCGLSFFLARRHLLGRAELLCVIYCMLISAPLMTQGFWHRIVAIVATNPRMADFEKLDAMNDRLWPHGANLLAGTLTPAGTGMRTGGDCRWEEIEVERGRMQQIPVLSNADVRAQSHLAITLPVASEGRTGVVPESPYIVSVLVRAIGIGPTASYTCRVRADDNPEFVEFFSSSLSPKVNFLHRTGFRRVGAYGVRFPAGARASYTIEFGLQGNGRLELHDPKLLNVASLEALYKGRLMVTADEAAALPPALASQAIIRPDSLWSVKGMLFVLGGYIPVRDWVGPISAWTSFILLLLSATFAVNVIMRRQWLDSERFQLPLTGPLVAMLEDADADRPMPSIWSNRLMYLGFAIALAWMMLKFWHFHNPKVPDVTVKVPLQEYFNDPSWGKMWERWRFEIEGVFLSLCIFMELNVLLSLVIGYALYRCQFWLGEIGGLTADPNYPYTDAQGIGAYLGYAVILIALSRKYLWCTLKAAVAGRRAGSNGEALSYRGAYLLLLGTLVGSVLWAYWLGIAAGSMLVFFVFLVTIGFVAARLRAECGTPWGYFVPWNLALFLGLLGGVWRFGPEAMIFCYLASFMIAPTVFYLIPGAQMELLGLGHRWNVSPRHLVVAATLGVLGGMLIGGWVFLSNAYALGGDTSRYQWAFDTKWWYFFPYNQDLNAANNQMLGQAVAATGTDPAWISFGASAGIMIVLTLLRQLFSGFWFHPVGFLLGSTDFMNYVWGSALTAWVIRSVALRLGGAATVRDKLRPFFVGAFLGSCTAYLVVLCHGAYLRSLGLEGIYPVLTP
jgi:hypothetical protein